MASTSECKYCGATILSNDQKCPNCGAPNPNYIEPMERTIFLPKTIEELQEYCAERGMPLLRMRFFVGENYKQPKAFGIYRDGDEVVVYKNKANGQRSIRYRGTDEAYGVNELFQKLLEECHKRGIYPDGNIPMDEKWSQSQGNPHINFKQLKPIIISAVLMASLAGYAVVNSKVTHANDGYYRSENNYYYRYGNDWYTSYDDVSGIDDGWYEIGGEPNYEVEYLGDDYDSDWEVSDFKSSDTWQEIVESHSSDSSDYDDWDSGDTDWDSDW